MQASREKYNNLIKEIDAKRKKRGYTQSDLAKKMNCTQALISKWLNGLSIIPKHKIAELRILLNMSLVEKPELTTEQKITYMDIAFRFMGYTVPKIELANMLSIYEVVVAKGGDVTMKEIIALKENLEK